MKKSYYIQTYGCQMNVHESEKIAGMARRQGFEPTEDLVSADLIVFNTCCIRETAEAKILGHIGQVKHLKEQNPQLIVAVCGCMTQQEGTAEKLKKRFPFIDIIIGTHNLASFEEKLCDLQQAHSVVEITSDDSIKENVPVYRTSGTNAWVNIIYGCNNFCTYCIVPYVRGREHSRKKEEIVKEVQELLRHGYREITLLGQNVNSYGKDLQDGSNFADLLNTLAQLPGKFRIRFMTSHPKDLTDDVIDVIAKNEKICNYIHLPVQAGSTKILEAMNRKYSKEQYLALVQKIRNRIPDVGISSDVMVGFPGETEEDFLETLDLIRQAGFSATFSFVFSRRKGTVAYSMPNQIDAATKKSRITRLIAAQNVITKEISKRYIGNVYEILVEDKQPKYQNVYCGRTDSGRLVNFRSDRDCIGEFVRICITECRSATLWGTEVE